MLELLNTFNSAPSPNAVAPSARTKSQAPRRKTNCPANIEGTQMANTPGTGGNGDENDGPQDDEYRRIAARRLQAYGADNVMRARPIDKAFIKHRNVLTGLEALDRAYQLAKQFKSLPMGLIVIGPPGVGKSSLIEYFCESLPRDNLIEPGMAAIVMRMRESMTPTYFVQRLLHLLKYPLQRASPRDYAARFDMALDVMARKGSLVLILDEAHHLMNTPTHGRDKTAEGGTISNLLCELVDRGIALVLVGGEGLKHLGQHDQFLASRCTATHTFENFNMSGQWAPLLRQFASSCSDPSLALLAEKGQVEPLYAATQGNLRRLKVLVAEAVMICAHAGRQAVTADDMRLAFSRALDQPDRVNPWKPA
jgi:type II secretory pathway predicted ATPase ExeA